MKTCFTSYRPFANGPVKQPFLESDPANIAYALGGDYFSFYTLRSLSRRQLADRLRAYDLVFVALDAEAIELVYRIIEVCTGRAVTYSEGHIADYQRLLPAGQVAFLKAMNAAAINFLYWEKYIPFYQTLTTTPVVYLPYPYLLDEVNRHRLPPETRPVLAVLPSGLAGSTRNGLATLAVAKRLLENRSVEEVACWLEPDTFRQDAQAVNYFLFSAPFTVRPRTTWFNWRKWLRATRIDYRGLLRLKSQLLSAHSGRQPAETVRIQCVTLYRRQNWWNYLAQLAPARLFIDLNNRESVGRNALDCAALGIACISTNRSDMQARLFPDTTLDDSWDIAGALTLCDRLLSDTEFYQRVVAYAGEAVKQFAPAFFRRRFDAIMERHLNPLPPPHD